MPRCFATSRAAQRALQFAVLGGSIWANGCAWNAPRPRPGVEELFREAVTQAAQHPENTSATAFADACRYNEPVAVSPQISHLIEEEIPTPAPLTEDGGDLPEEGQQRVFQEFIETDLGEALLLMATDAGVDMVLDDRVGGVVNTTIDEPGFEAALDKLLLPFGFVYVKRRGQYVVTTGDPQSPLFEYVAQTTEYHPRHLETKELLEVLPERLRKYARVLEKVNTILIEAPRPHTQMILKRLSKMDQPVPQVVLEAIICVVSPDCGFRIGFDWNHAVEMEGEQMLHVGASGLAMTGIFSPVGLEHAFDDFALTSSFVKLLAENGYLTIRAAPRVMAKDGEKANISIARETFFSVQPYTGNSDSENQAFFVQPEIQKVESGISLAITPKIRGDIVTVEIEKAEVSEDIRNANTELALNPFPIINRRAVTTTVHVKDGKTIVIGGLVGRQTVERINRVPVLSRIPIIGCLFENIQYQEQDAEVVIFISPRVVKPTASPACCVASDIETKVTR